MNTKIEMNKIINNLSDNEFIDKYSDYREIYKKDSSSLYFDYYVSFNSKGILSSVNNLYGFMGILKSSDFIYYESLNGFLMLLKFFTTNKKNNIRMQFNNIVMGFNVEENIIYISCPFYLSNKNNLDNKNYFKNIYDFKNTEIMIKAGVIYVDNKKVINLKNYLIYEYLRTYKKLINNILPEAVGFEYDFIDIEKINKEFENNNKLIELINY